MWKFLTHPLVFIGICAAAAYYLLPKDKWPLGSHWLRTANNEIWTVYTKNPDGSVIFKIMSAVGAESGVTDAIPLATLDFYLTDGTLQAIPT